MKIINFGSLNLDYVYSVDHIVLPGETISSDAFQIFCGGKGLNQSIALARAGAEVHHAGLVGQNGGMLVDFLQKNGVICKNVLQVEENNGSAIIQLNKKGQNSIILYGGSNRVLTKEYIDNALDEIDSMDFVLLQNETNLVDYIIDAAYERGARVVMNLSPYDEGINACDLFKVWMIFINEIEGEQIAGTGDVQKMPKKILELYPDLKIVLTLGENGSVYQDNSYSCKQRIFKTKVIDTTGAGDTFLGFFVASILRGNSAGTSLKTAAMAASLAVSKKGAAQSIPMLEDVEKALEGIVQPEI